MNPIARMYIGVLFLLLCVGIGKYVGRRKSSLRMRRITVILVTFVVSWVLFIALDAWWRAGQSNYLGMLMLFAADALGIYHPLFL